MRAFLLTVMCGVLSPALGTVRAATFSHDSLNRLTSADYGIGFTISYSYDANGNRLSRTITAPTAAPKITTSPSPQMVSLGQPVAFSVVASGNPLPTYQWRKAGIAIGGATLATYTISSAASGDAGTYDVVITNTLGSVTTTPVSLTVTTPAPSFPVTPSANGNGTISPATVQQVSSGASVTFTATPSPGYAVWQWFVNGFAVQTGGVSLTIASISSTTSVQVGFVPDSNGVVLQPGPGDANDIWTTSIYSYAPGGSTPGGGLNEDTLRVGGWGDTYVSLLAFKLDTLPAVAQSATLYLYCYSNNSGSTTGLYVDRVISAWDWQTTGTGRDRLRLWWADRPLSVPFSSSALPAPALSAWYAIDITSLYNDWKNGAVPNYGVELRPAGISNNFDFFYSADYQADPTLRPKLVVVGQSPGVYFALQPTSLTVNEGSLATFSALAAGASTISYQWYLGNAAIFGATSATYAISAATLAHAGTYSVVATAGATGVTSSGATLAVNTAPVITTQPSSLQVSAGAQAIFTVSASGIPPPSYQWFFNGTAIPGATATSYSISAVTSSHSGNYTVTATNAAGTNASAVAVLTVSSPSVPSTGGGGGSSPPPIVPVSPPSAVAPAITSNPTSVTVIEGGSATFTVVATGTPALGFQWSFNGTTIPGATSASYTIKPVAAANVGSYAVTVSNSAGTVTSTDATLAITALPAFISQPKSQEVQPGTPVNFSASVSGVPNPTFQWLFNGTPIIGATSATYTIPSPDISNVGSYALVASNTTGMVTSNGALLSVTTPQAPKITSEPQSHTVATGGTVVLSVAIDGAVSAEQARFAALVAGPSYQWYANGAPIPGATGSILIIRSLTAANSGDYNCLISTGLGSALSKTASIAVSSSGIPGRLVNISSRALTRTGDDILIAGFVIGGSAAGGTMPILLRAAGPALSAFQLAGIPNPTITLFRGGTQIDRNAGWLGNSQIGSIASSVGAFSWGEAATPDSALYEPGLNPTLFTAQVKDENNRTGVSLLEVYDTRIAGTWTSDLPRLLNISSRAFVGEGDNILVAGFVISGATSKTVLIRAAGPALQKLGVGGTLSHPHLTLFADKTAIAVAPQWAADVQLATVADSVGAFSFGNSTSSDRALLITLVPGLYTAQVAGENGETGVGLVEIYDIP